MESSKNISPDGSQYEKRKTSDYLRSLSEAVAAADRQSPYLYDTLQGGLKEIVGNMLFHGDEKDLLNTTCADLVIATDRLTNEHGWSDINDIDTDELRKLFSK